jgi:hypothetical protein
MQRMCPNIPPESIQAHFLTRGLCTRDFKYARGDAQPSIGRDDFDACNPLCQFSSFASSKLCTVLEVATISGVDCVNLFTGAICEGRGGTQVCVEIAVAFENVELVCCPLFILDCVSGRSWRPSISAYIATERPCSRALHGVLGSILLRTESNAEIEVTEDELD